MKLNRLPLAAALLLGATLTPLPALAQEGAALGRVEVSRGTLRHDVARSCPAVAATLQEGMDRAVSVHQIEGSYRVEFELSGRNIVSVRTPFAPREYRQALRSAVRSLACQDAAAQQQPQRYGFILDVKAVPSAPHERMAAAGPRYSVALRSQP